MGNPTPTYEMIADRLKAKIFDLIEGNIQSYSISGRTFTLFNIEALARMEEGYRAKAGSETEEDAGLVSFADLSGGF